MPCPITASCPFSIVLRHGCTAGKLTSCSKNHSINFCLYGCSFARMQCTVLVPKKKQHRDTEKHCFPFGLEVLARNTKATCKLDGSSDFVKCLPSISGEGSVAPLESCWGSSRPESLRTSVI